MFPFKRPLRLVPLTTLPRNFSTTSSHRVSAPGPQDGPKGNATGLNTNTDGMKSGEKDNTTKRPVDQQPDTPNVEDGGNEGAHPAKRAKPQPEPTRSTGIKGKEEMG